MKHTPGPWEDHYLPQHRMRITTQKMAVTICDIALWTVDYEEQTANASLIAASPELLTAGELLLKAYGEAHALYDLGDCEGSILMRAAIDKATK